MRGVSAIIVTILLLMISVSLASFAYMFFTRTFSSVADTGSETVEHMTTSMLANINIDSISADNDKVYIRNTGKTDLTQFYVYVNNNIDSGASAPSSVIAGDIDEITLSVDIVPGDVIKVSTAEGAIAIKSVPGGGGGCTPDGACNGVCSCIGDSRDPDCVCQNGNGCCGLGCTNTNDNDCPASCTSDGNPCLTGSQCCNGVCISGTCGQCSGDCTQPCSSGSYNYNDGSHFCEGITSNTCNAVLGEGQGDCDCDENCQSGLYCDQINPGTDYCCPIGTSWDGSNCVSSIFYNWGITTNSFSSTYQNEDIRCMHGLSPNVANMRITSVDLALTDGATAAVAIYFGGSEPSPSGTARQAEVLNQVFSTGGWKTFTLSSELAWPANTVTWICWKRSGTGGVYYSGSASDAGNYYTSNGRYAFGTSPQNPATSFPSAISGGSFSSYWYSIYLRYYVA